MATGRGLAIDGVGKRFGDTVALKSLSLTIPPGEIVGVAGPNGAGKSTLVKILAAEQTADQGAITLDGSPLTPSLSATAVAVVHQEPQLFPNLTVGQNLMAGRECRRFGAPQCGPAEQRLLEELRIGHLRDWPLEHCSLATRQRTEIARALARDARVFLFDEPNSALTETESAELFEEMHRLASAGRVVILVSHRISDLARHAGRVLIIRDGAVCADLARAELAQDVIARELVADEHFEQLEPERRLGSSLMDCEPVLKVRGWTDPHDAFLEVDLDVAARDVTAIVGVEGSGGRELLRSVAGLRDAHGSMETTLAGRNRPRLVYVPATRELSLFSNLDVGHNLVARLSADIAVGGMLIRPRRIQAIAEELISRFRIKTSGLAQAVRSLSGGNQQKVAIAGAVAQRPDVLLLEEPTRGVDINSRREIYRLLRAFAALGQPVIVYCTEVPEIFELADKVYVMSQGRVSLRLNVDDFSTVEELAAEIAGGEEHGAGEEAA